MCFPLYSSEDHTSGDSVNYDQVEAQDDREISFSQNANPLGSSYRPSNVLRECLVYQPFLYWLGQRDDKVSFLTTYKCSYIMYVLMDKILELSLSYHFI